MATSSFVRVVTPGGFDLTPHIGRFSFEDCLEEDDQLRLTLHRADIALLDNPALQKGQQLLFTFGYIGGPQAKERSARITGIEPDFSTALTIGIICGDAGQRLKKQQAAALYQGKTSSQIATEIAKKHGLTPQVDATTFVWRSLPQAGRTDFELLKYLASQEQQGSFRFFIKQGVLHFNKVNLRKQPRRTFTWGGAANNVVRFQPSDNDNKKKGRAALTTVAGVNPETGQPFSAQVKDAPDDVKLGTFNVHYNGDGQEVGRDRPAPATGRVTVPVTNAAQAADVAAAAKKNAGNKDVTAKLEIVGDPLQEADELITVNGVGRRFSGNWHVKKLVHDVVPGSVYVSRFELTRNATNLPQGDGAKAATKNNAAGPATTEGKRPVNVIYDGNSNEVGRRPA